MATGRYECNLNEQLIAKAIAELHEPADNEQRLVYIDELLRSYKEKYPEQQLDSDEEKDEFLLRFLRARKFDIDRAVLMMHNYITRRQTFPEAFESVDNEELMKRVIATKFITVLDGSAKNGSKIVLVRPCYGSKDPKIFDIFAGAFYAIEKLLRNEEAQIHGVTLLEDFQYINLKLAKQMGPVIGKKFASILQETLPMRLKNICLVNGNALFTLVFTIVRPFLKEKTKQRIIMVGKEYEKLQTVITLQNLPEAYGGEIKGVDLKSCNDCSYDEPSTSY